MGPASARLRRIALALSAALVAFLISPVAPLVAAEDGGLGAGGAAFAYNYTWILGLVLSFVFGFGLRDYIQKRMLRAQAKKRSAPRPVATQSTKPTAKPASKPVATSAAAPPRP